MHCSLSSAPFTHSRLLQNLVLCKVGETAEDVPIGGEAEDDAPLPQFIYQTKVKRDPVSLKAAIDFAKAREAMHSILKCSPPRANPETASAPPPLPDAIPPLPDLPQRRNKQEQSHASLWRHWT